MTYLNDSFYFMAIALNASLICIYLLSRLRKQQNEINQFRKHTRTELDSVVATLRKVLQRQRYLAAEMTVQAEKIQELRDASSTEPGFDHANRLLELGLDSEQLAQGLGLSSAEADLLSLVHSNQREQKKGALKPQSSRAA